jgi:hypothetical protein
MLPSLKNLKLTALVNHLLMLINKNLGVLIYAGLMLLMIFIMPLYGDPAIVVWSSKITAKTGFAYDPVCSRNITVAQKMMTTELCVRSPLYYMLLAVAGTFYKVIPALLFITFITLQYYLARLNRSNLDVFGLMFPPVYLLFTRTYVDTLTATLMTALLLTLTNIARQNKPLHRIFLFVIPLLIVLARESAVALPLFLIILLMTSSELKNTNLLIAFLGYILGLVSWQFYVSLSGGASYSDFQPHIPTAIEAYRALMTTITPILPWEIQPQDILAYVNIPFIGSLHPLIVLSVHLLGILAFITLLFSLVYFKHVNKLVLSQIIFGLVVAAGLLFLKGDIDFFRHLAFLIPTIPLLVGKGLEEIRTWNKWVSFLIKTAYVLLFVLYFARTVRLYMAGYSFDPCQYLLKRPEISSIAYFYETACA